MSKTRQQLIQEERARLNTRRATLVPQRSDLRAARLERKLTPAESKQLHDIGLEIASIDGELQALIDDAIVASARDSAEARQTLARKAIEAATAALKHDQARMEVAQRIEGWIVQGTRLIEDYQREQAAVWGAAFDVLDARRRIDDMPSARFISLTNTLRNVVEGGVNIAFGTGIRKTGVLDLTGDLPRVSRSNRISVLGQVRANHERLEATLTQHLNASVPEMQEDEQ